MKILKIFTDFEDAIAPLGDAERGRLFAAMLRYARTGEELKLSGNERFIWPIAKSHIDRCRENYEQVSAVRSEAGKKGGLAKSGKAKQKEANAGNCLQDKDKDKEKIKETYRGRTPVNLDEVIEYSHTFTLQNIPVSECEKFYDHFSSNGWKVSGKAPMKDWKAAFRNWVRNLDKYAPAKKAAAYNQHQHTDEDLKHLLVDLDA